MASFDTDQVDDKKALEQIKQSTEEHFCTEHLCKLVKYKTDKKTGKQYRKCPVPKCKVRKGNAIPKANFWVDPMKCPCCNGEQFLKVAKNGYKNFTVRMDCPASDCNYFVEVPRPDIEVQRRRVRS